MDHQQPGSPSRRPTDAEWLAERFEAERTRLRSVAYRMLGSLPEADDAVQEAWLRLSRSDAEAISNLAGWLTTVVGRVCLDMLRSRTTRRELPLEAHVPDPVIADLDAPDPEAEAILGESIGLALLVVLDTLPPAERLAFVLHDMFAVPFEQIGTVLNRSTAASKMLASRARARLQGAPAPDADPSRQHEVVQAFLAASRDGDFEALVAVLDPDVLLRVDAGPERSHLSKVLQGAGTVASQALQFATQAKFARIMSVNGSPGLVSVRNGQITGVMSLSVADGRVVQIDLLVDLDRLARL